MKYTYHEIIKNTYELLDKMDIRSYLIKGHTTEEIMKAIEKDAEDKCLPANIYKHMKDNSDFFCDDPFNWIAPDEFQDYCEQRYPDLKWRTEVIERTYLVN